jgi:hypothetical protein
VGENLAGQHTLCALPRFDLRDLAEGKLGEVGRKLEELKGTPDKLNARKR